MEEFQVYNQRVYSMSLKGVASETVNIVKRGTYQTKLGQVVVCRNEIDHAIAGTCLYRPDELLLLLADRKTKKEPRKLPKIELTTETTAEASRRLYEAGERNVVALNFASAKNPGGGFLGGAKAQEEDLARCSALFDCQLTQREYYEANRREHSLLYTDHIIYSPDVPFFRDEKMNLLASMFLTSIITVPAPNSGQYLRQERNGYPKVLAALERRVGMLLSVAAEKGHRTLVLGAWGCGVFQNNPHDVATAFSFWLQHSGFSNAFERIIFGIYERDKKRPNLEAFRHKFKETFDIS
jgi:uncharacterized protein (TIGR02452 family)